MGNPRIWSFFCRGETKSVPLLHYIKRVAYIDTPMITGSQLIGGRDYWMKLSTLLNDNSQIGKKFLYIRILLK